MNTIQFTRHNAPISAATLSLLKLQSGANKAGSDSFSQHLTAHVNRTAVPSYGIVSQPSVARQNSATSTSAAQTPATLATQLLAANPLPPPQPLQPINAPLYSSGYAKQLNYNGFVSQANLQNQKTAAEYQLNVSNWALNEGQRQSLGLASQPPPTAPQYVAVNGAGFDQWWSGLANFGDAPPITFITPVSNQSQAASTVISKSLA